MGVAELLSYLELLRSIRLVSLVTDEEGKVVQFSAKDGIIRLTVDNRDGFAEDKILADGSGSITCAIQSSYLIEPLSALPDVEVTLKFSGEVTPLVLEAKSFTYLLMPVVK